jgi:riboflavin biosynthesis pyrimidine reductase
MTGIWRERFDALVEWKTREAAGASLHPYVTESEHPPERATVIGNDWSRRLFGGGFHVSPARMAQRPACSLVFVQSADGNTGASNPGALGGGETDKHLIYEGLSRVGADGVLAGAETVRDANLVFSVWHPELVALRASLGLPRHPVQIIATLKGLDLEGSLLFNVPEIPVVLLTVAAAARTMPVSLGARPWVTALVMNEPAALPAAFEQMRSQGIARLSCVGGRTLARQLLDAHLVDEVYLTTAARPGGDPGTPIHTRPWRGAVAVRKHGTGPEAGVVFEHVLTKDLSRRAQTSRGRQP